MPSADEHQYDYAYAEENDLSNRRRPNQQAQMSGQGQRMILKAVQNPYYSIGGVKMEVSGQHNVIQGTENTGYECEGGTNETESERPAEPSNMMTTEVAENPYLN